MSKTPRRVGLAVLGAGIAALAAFASAGPAAADNGPHVSYLGTAISGADGCAGCHRLHTAQDADPAASYTMFRFASNSDAAFCETCHGSGAPGATTNVVDGLSTVGVAGSTDPNAMNTGHVTQLNTALRAGGFKNTAMGTSLAVAGNIKPYAYGNYTSPNKFAVAADYSNQPGEFGQSYWGDLIPAAAATTASTSSHLPSAGGDGINVTMWGASSNTESGTTVTLECVSCHNPHGNGNFRILRPIGFEEGFTASDSVTVRAGVLKTEGINVAGEFNTITNADITTLPGYTIFLTGETPTVFVGQKIRVRTGGTLGTDLFNATQGSYAYAVSDVSKTAPFSITVAKTATTSGPVTAYAMGGFPSTVLKAEVQTVAVGSLPPTLGQSGTVATDARQSYLVKYTMASTPGLYQGQLITLGSAAKAGALVLSRAKIESITASAFYAYVMAPTLTAPASAGLEAGLYMQGIPDALSVTTGGAGVGPSDPGIAVGPKKHVYTTANYFQADDRYYSGSFVAANGTYGTAVIANIAQWCASCHTQYLNNDRTVKNGGSSSLFMFRHASGRGAEGDANCLTCHVAHGSSAQMNGFASNVPLPTSQAALGTAPTNNLTTAPAGVTFEDSALLRVDNRGICLMCHNPSGKL